MRNVRSTLTPGHIVIRVKDLQASVDFYERIGLPAYEVWDSISIIELRGGTHVILMTADSPDAAGMAPSRHGQRGEAFDLMIEGNEREHLLEYREALVANGIEAGEVSVEPYFGHYILTVTDPDGNDITVYTSHEIKYAV